MATHTPGPWRLLPLNWGLQILPATSSIARKRPVIGTVSAWTDDKREDQEALANARLIAAAPDLLEALINLKEAVDVIATAQCESGESELIEWGNRRTAAGWQAAVKADPAIAKAEGRER
jgi:hypothetical protein